MVKGVKMARFTWDLQQGFHIKSHRHRQTQTQLEMLIYDQNFPFVQMYSSTHFSPSSASTRGWSLNLAKSTLRGVPVQGEILGHSLLQFWKAQKGSLRIAIYRIARWLTLVSAFFPFWPQPVLGDCGILAATIQFQYFPDCTVLVSYQMEAGIRNSRYGYGVLDHPSLLLLSPRQENNVGLSWNHQVALGALHHHREHFCLFS